MSWRRISDQNRAELRFAALALCIGFNGISRELQAQSADAVAGGPENAGQDPNEPTPEEPAAEVRERAREAFERGVAAYRDGAFELARIEFRKAYDLVSDYRVLYNIGQVNYQLRHYAEALIALERYLKQGGAAIPPERRGAAEQNINTLRSRTARLTIRSNVPKASVSIEGKVLGETPLVDLLVDAGQLELTLKKTGYSSAERSVTLAGGDTATLDIPLESLDGTLVIHPRPRALDAALSERSSFPWVGWVTTGVLAAGALTSGALMLSAVHDLDELEREPVHRGRADDAEQRARSFAIAADVLGAAALVAGGVSLYFTLDASANEPRRAKSRISQLRLKLSPDRLELDGKF